MPKLVAGESKHPSVWFSEVGIRHQIRAEIDLTSVLLLQVYTNTSNAI